MDTAKQMEMAFMMEEGGLTDDGTTVDPVSGNEVPPGSLAEEVRDDIPAQLSEGEYVVPADVVRFYGVKFFEDLRGEAKRGMMEMEANGRIGGEPIEMSEGDVGDLTPEEVAALEQVTGMAMGGSVQANPYLQQQQMYSQGYAAGGEVDPNVPQFTQQTGTSFAPGFLAQQMAPTTPAVTVVTLYGPNGEVRTLSLPAQQTEYDTLIQQGYTTEPVATTTETAVGQAATPSDDKPSYTAEQRARVNELIGQQQTFNIGNIKSEDLEKTAKGLSLMGNVAAGLSSVIGAPVAALVNTGAVARYNDIVERMESEGIETDLQRKGSIFGGESSIYSNLKDMSGDNKVSFADTWLGDLLGFDGESGVQGPSLKESWGGARREQEYKAPESEEAKPEPVDTRTPEQKVDDAVSDWQAATAAVQNTSTDDPAAWTAAIRAQSDASKAATKAIQEKTGWTGFFSPPKDE
jgi:hypothetical protein